MGEAYYSLAGKLFHSDCLLDNYTLHEVLELLCIKEHYFAPLKKKDDKFIEIGKYRNIQVLRTYNEYAKRQYKSYKEAVRALSSYKKERGVEAIYETDRHLLEKWLELYEKRRLNDDEN